MLSYLQMYGFNIRPLKKLSTDKHFMTKGKYGKAKRLENLFLIIYIAS